jgi:ABC-type multidrug transport system fused ATPase/permease subunit
MHKDFKLINKKKDPKTALLFILSLFKSYYKEIVVVLFFSLTATTASVLIPQTLQIAIDQNIPNKDLTGLSNTALIFIILMLIFFFTTILQTLFSGNISQKVLFSLRSSLFKKLQELPLAFFNQNKTGDIEIRISSNVENINRFFSEGVIRMLNIGVSLIGFLIMMWILNTQMASVVIIATLFFLLFLYFQGNVLRIKQKKAFDIEGAFSSRVSEIMTGFPTIKIFNKDKPFFDIFMKQNLLLKDQNLRVLLISALGDGILPFLQISCGALIIYSGFWQLSINSISAGELIAFLSYLVLYFRRFEGIGSLWNTVQSGIAASQRILELYELESNIVVADPLYLPRNVYGKVEFEHVDFSYEDEVNVLKDIDLVIAPGKSVAVVGPTGGGKTSFVSLIARLYDPDKGRIKIDDIDIKRWDLKQLREHIGYLIQETFFFEDTVLNNLKYDLAKISKEDVEEMVKKMELTELIAALPQGLDTIIKPDSMSQGQRQLLALLRLALRDPKILILDEATANIDTRTEQILIKALYKVIKNKTTFIIAHRLSTIFNSDLILLIQNNTILEKGTHEELLKKEGKYFEIYSKFVAK